jgi:multiple sugar transport system substrate-binding protein
MRLVFYAVAIALMGLLAQSWVWANPHLRNSLGVCLLGVLVAFAILDRDGIKTVFNVAFLTLLSLSVVAKQIQPPIIEDGKIPLIWVSDDNPARRDQINLFNELNPKYKLKLDPVNSGSEKVIVQSIAGVGPDLFNTYSGMDLVGYVRAGIALDITDDLAAMGLDIGTLYPASDSVIKLDGRVYGFPTNVGADALWFNKDIFEERGIPYPQGPWTWEQFITLAQKMTERDENGRVIRYGLLCDWGRWNQFIFQWGGSIYSPDGTRCTVDSPEAIAGVQFLHDLIYKYHVLPSPVEEAAMATQGGWGSGYITQFSSGRAAMAIGGRWWLCLLRDNKKLRLGATEAPYGTKRVFLGYAKGTLINANSPRAKDALAFLAYEASKPYNDLINHQADALAPVRTFNETEEFLHDPEFPHEDYNAVWRDVMNYAITEQLSPYVNASVAGRIISGQLDLARANHKPVAEALKRAAMLVNEEIANTLELDSELKARYLAAIAAQKAEAPIGQGAAP